MRELILIRHGEAEHLVNGTGGGWADTPLTSKGLSQADLTGRKLRDLLSRKKVNMYTSDLARARETAFIIGQYLDVEPRIDSDLRGLSLGVAGEMNKEEAAKIKKPLTLPIFDWIQFPEAESQQMMQHRVNRFMDNNVNRKNETSIIVAHGNSCVSVLYWWFNIQRKLLTKMIKPSFTVEPCSCTHVLADDASGKRTIKYLNDSRHLEQMNA
ncbi:hypothetical protein AK95_15205 [Paenibacillus sp. LC231]|uniref:histidine phosphatase family protein n=1 Tax=Paenibacillus sp. LC231 TaxID=1120679 RepID=UPI0008DDA46D|nr:histidine phosphatase family protein [Paenibacillus sp. LC231]OIB04954.1 hypothetical protein AK95_15205 [Paenibacillus sp. LC231]